MGGNQFYFSIAYEEGDGVTGGCLDRKSNKKFQSLPNYPQCSIVNGVVNFFLARTDAVNRVRFDPKLKRVAHSGMFPAISITCSPWGLCTCIHNERVP